MKKLISLFVTLLFSIGLSVSAFAVPQADPAEKFYDYAHLISTNDELRLREELQLLSESSGFDVVAVLMDDNEGYSSADYADDFYDYNGFADNGLLLLINLDDREVYVSTCGEAMSYFTDGIIDDMTYELVEPLADGDYDGAVILFVQQCKEILQAPPKGESSSVSTQKPPIYEAPEKQGKDWVAFIGTAALGSAVFGGIVVAIMSALHNKLPSKKQSTFHYVSGGKVQLTRNRDIFLNSTVHKTRIQQDTVSRSGGSSGRSHSHTTMHRSSSGRMHGGGGRRF